MVAKLRRGKAAANNGSKAAGAARSGAVGAALVLDVRIRLVGAEREAGEEQRGD